MNPLNNPLFYFLCIFLFSNYAQSLLDLPSNSDKIVRITAPIKPVVDGSSVVSAQIYDLCIGTPPQCFPVTLSIFDKHTLILNSTIVNYGITPRYNSSISETFVKDKNLFISVETVFGRVNEYKANDTLTINPSKITQINSDNAVNLPNFDFRLINKINKPSKFVSYGVLGLGHKSEFLYQLKTNSIIDKITYSVELADDKNYLEIFIGDISPKLKEISYQDKISYCNITNSDFYAMEYWGCNADLYLRSENKRKYLLSQIVTFFEIIGEEKHDVPVIYFVKTRSQYQDFLIEGMLHNNTKCGVNSLTDIIECDKDLDIKSLPNLLFVMNKITYIFKPEDLFYLNTITNKLILKVKFTDEGSINHIKLSQHLLLSLNVSMVYDLDKKQAGFYGFNTHKYRGDDDDGNEENEEGGDHSVLIFFIIFASFVLSAVGYIFYRIRRRNHNPSEYIRY